jgi:phage terminase small subunit
MIKLNTKQQRFIEFYDGNATSAAIQAGYAQKNARVQGHRLLTNAYIIEAIKNREVKNAKKKIASREERAEFFSKVMNDPNEKMFVRLKAADLLCKMNGDYIERHEHSGEIVINYGHRVNHLEPTDSSIRN